MCNSKRRCCLGDGCIVCDTELAIETLPQPIELAEKLKMNGFSDDQAEEIVRSLYQPLVSLISALNSKVNSYHHHIPDPVWGDTGD